MNIPRWFHAANYDCVKNWTAKEWSHAVFTRELIFDTHRAAKLHSNLHHIEALIDALNVDRSCAQAGSVDTWNLIVKAIHLKPEGILDYSYYDRRAEIVGVSPISLRHLGWLYSEATFGLAESAIDYLAGSANDAESAELIKLGETTFEDRNIELGFGPERYGNDMILSINLDMPDDMLMKQLSQLIHESRKKYGIEPLVMAPSLSDFRRWHEAMILGYYDLMLLAQINKAPMTNEQVGTQLFPSEFNVSLADRIRKVTKPLSAAVIRESMFMALDLAREAEELSQKVDPERQK